ncbi:MAG: hypothetical protein RR500_08945 [Bacilli bacterium]
MKFKIDNCHYELVKDLLLSLDSVIQNVEKADKATIVTLHAGNSQEDLVEVLNRAPLYTFCENANIYAL